MPAAEPAPRPITIVGDDPRVDILTVAWTVTFDKAWEHRVVRRIQDTRVPYLCRDDLVASKQTGRASDLADVDRLSCLPLPVRRREPRRK